ncbi:MAG: type 4a pilus biogenesis protein PilO [Actinobacteria bacterium]|nr:type 4a pilus biogenesis protein PilO [Actinomycetota bacterium]
MTDRISGRVSLLVVSIALILVLAIGWFGLVSPERSKASKLDRQIAETNVQLQGVTDLLRGGQGKQSLAQLRVFAKAVPSDAQMSQILRQLSSIASASGVEVDAVTPQALTPLSVGQALPITLMVKGHYFGLQRFLHALRSEAELHGQKLRATGRLYTVDNIVFTGGQSPSGQPAGPTTSGQVAGGDLIQAALSLNAFVFTSAAPTATPSGDSSASTTSAAAATTP